MASKKETQKEIIEKLGELLFIEKINLIDENGGEVSYQWIRNKLKNKLK